MLKNASACYNGSLEFFAMIQSTVANGNITLQITVRAVAGVSLILPELFWICYNALQ